MGHENPKVCHSSPQSQAGRNAGEMDKTFATYRNDRRLSVTHIMNLLGQARRVGVRENAEAAYDWRAQQD
jgi:hypothetical protein